MYLLLYLTRRKILFSDKYYRSGNITVWQECMEAEFQAENCSASVSQCRLVKMKRHDEDLSTSFCWVLRNQ